MAFFILFLGLSKTAMAYNVEGEGVCNCNSCADCMSAFSDNTNCVSTIKLTTDIVNHSGTCFLYPSGSNKVFDGQNNTMDGDGTGRGFYFSGQSGWTIQNVNFSDWSNAIRNYGGHQNLIIQDNTFTSCTSSTIYLMNDCSGTSILDNTFSNIYKGIHISSENNTDVTVENNIIENITNMIGIDVSGKTDILIKGNDVSIGGDSEHQNVHGMNVKIYDGIVENNTIHDIWIGGHILDHPDGQDNIIYRNNTFSNFAHGGLYLQGDGGTIQDNTISNLDFNTELPSGSNYLVQNNILGSVELKGGRDNTITNNTISGSLSVAGSYCNNDVYGNTISYNTFTDAGSIEIAGTWRFYDNTISHNTFTTTNSYAISFNNADNNTIENNNVISSVGDAFPFASNTHDNKGCGNVGTITDLGTDNYVSNTSQSCYIWDCEDLNNTGRLGSNGTYLLGQAISNNSGSCMSFQANDLTLNCQSNVIDGDGTGTGVSFSGITNGILSNCVLANFANDYNLVNSTNIDLNGDLTFSGSANSANINISDSLVDIDYQTSAMEGLSLSNIDRALNLNVSDTVSILITPVSGLVDLIIDTWNTATTYYKKWTETGDENTGNTTHTIGDLKTNTYYTVKVGTNRFNTYLSNGSGEISFTYTGGYSSHEFEIEEDTTPPAVFDLSSPSDNSYTNDNTPTLSWNASSDSESGLAKYQLYIDGALNKDNINSSATSTEPTSSLSDSSYTWYVKAIDNAGNERQSTSTRTIGVDVTSPVISLSSPANNSSTGNTKPTLIWSGSDATSGIAKYQLYVDNSLDTDNISATSVTPANNLSCGSHTWYVKAIDNASNSTSSSTFNLTIACGSGLPSSAYNPPSQPEPTPDNPENNFSVEINNNDEYTNNQTVTLKLNAGSNTKRMAISNNPDFKNASQVPCQEEIEWDLLGNPPSPLLQRGNTYTVYAKFYTQYGVASEVVGDSIILKTETNSQKDNQGTGDNNNLEDSNQQGTPDLKTSSNPNNSQQPDQTESAEQSSTTFTQTLKFNSNNNQVINLQNKLKELNFFPEEIKSNGNFGSTTKQAVIDYQESRGIYPCGIIGPRTRKALNNESFITNQDYAFTKDLKYNDRNNEVKQLQTRLRDTNFFPYYVNSTGWFGPITQKAVKLFQKFYELIENGVVGEEMRERLN